MAVMRGTGAVSSIGHPVFHFAGNVCDWFRFGERGGDDYWLEGEVVGPPPEFVFNGRIFAPGFSIHGTIIDNFPKGPTPLGWSKIAKLGSDDQLVGYDLVDESGNVLFGYRILHGGAGCLVSVNLYTKKGNLIARTHADFLEVLDGPGQFGKHGFSITKNQDL